MEFQTNNPMQPDNLANAPRCGARTRTGSPCRSPAVRDRRRCRMHGGTNRGAPKGNRNAWLHGDRSVEAEEQLKTVRQLKRTLQAITKLQQGVAMRGVEIHQLFDAMIEAGRNQTNLADVHPGSEDHSGSAHRG